MDLLQELLEELIVETDGGDVVFNEDKLIGLSHLFPKQLVKAVRLLEFRLVYVVSVGESGNVISGTEGNICEKIFGGEGCGICSDDFGEIVGKQKMTLFKDVDYEARDDDSDEEFIEKYEGQKKVYGRRDSVIRYLSESSNRWNLNVEDLYGEAISNVNSDKAFRQFEAKFESQSARGKNHVGYDVIQCEYHHWWCSCTYFQTSLYAKKDNHTSRTEIRSFLPDPRIPVCSHLLALVLAGQNFLVARKLFHAVEVDPWGWSNLNMGQFPSL